MHNIVSIFTPFFLLFPTTLSLSLLSFLTSMVVSTVIPFSKLNLGNVEFFFNLRLLIVLKNPVAIGAGFLDKFFFFSICRAGGAAAGGAAAGGAAAGGAAAGFLSITLGNFISDFSKHFISYSIFSSIDLIIKL